MFCLPARPRPRQNARRRERDGATVSFVIVSSLIIRKKYLNNLLWIFTWFYVAGRRVPDRWFWLGPGPKKWKISLRANHIKKQFQKWFFGQSILKRWCHSPSFSWGKKTFWVTHHDNAKVQKSLLHHRNLTFKELPALSWFRDCNSVRSSVRCLKIRAKLSSNHEIPSFLEKQLYWKKSVVSSTFFGPACGNWSAAPYTRPD